VSITQASACAGLSETEGGSMANRSWINGKSLLSARGLVLVLVAVSLGTSVARCSGPIVGSEGVFEILSDFGPRAFSYFLSRTSAKPYDPGAMAWGWQYQARACLIAYRLTHESKWLDWALNITDYFVEYSDVNGDGIPAWGNYNESWGNPRYDYREYTVWDGVIGLPIIEAAQLILSDPQLSQDPYLVQKASRYVDLIRQVIRHHRPAWTQVSPDQGYYWDDLSSDIGPIMNRFCALGRVEMVLGDVTGNASYYERPRQMANYVISHMKLDEDDDLYTWSYVVGGSGSEDISHAAIGLEFLIMANQRGIVETRHMRRLCNTYLKRIWQLPRILEGRHLLATYVDGRDTEGADYARISRNWILLAQYRPLIYGCQRAVFSILALRGTLGAGGVDMLGLVQIALVAQKLEREGYNPELINPLTAQEVNELIEHAILQLERARELGSAARQPEELLREATGCVAAGRADNSTLAVFLVNRAWNQIEEMITVGETIRDLEAKIEESEQYGVVLDAEQRNLSEIRSIFQSAEPDQLSSLIPLIESFEASLDKKVAWSYIQTAESLIEQARGLGFDTHRYEIFLARAKQEYEKGNYGPSKEFAKYPLRLSSSLSELPGTGLVALPFILLPLAIVMSRCGRPTGNRI